MEELSILFLNDINHIRIVIHYQHLKYLLTCSSLVNQSSFLCLLSSLCLSQLDQGCVIPCPTAEDITKRGVPPMSPPLAMWEKEAQVVELEKGESGLGFSILDYQVRDVSLSPSTNRTDCNRLQSKNINAGLDRVNTENEITEGRTSVFHRENSCIV